MADIEIKGLKKAASATKSLTMREITERVETAIARHNALAALA